MGALTQSYIKNGGSKTQPHKTMIYIYIYMQCENYYLLYIYYINIYILNIYIYIFNIEKRELLVVKTDFSQLVLLIGRFQRNLF